MKYKITILAAAFLAIAACNKGNSTDARAFEEGQMVTVCVGAGKSSTKVIGTDDPANDRIGFVWEEGDQILITVGDKSSTFTLSSGAGSSKATFTGKMPASGSEFDVSYPVNDPDLSQQAYNADKIPAGKIAFTATDCTLDEEKELSPANSILQLNLYGTSQTIGKIVVTNVDSEATTYTLNISGGKELGTTAGTATPFFVVVPNGKYKISAAIFDNADTPVQICKFTTSKELEFGDSDAGGCINMSAKEVAVATYEAKIGTTNYSTLADAIAAANETSDATIELLKDVTVDNTTLSISKNMTIDMGGFSITCSKPIQSETSYPFLVTTSDISLTFKNGVIIDGALTNEFDSFIAGASLGFSGSASYTLNLTDVDFGVFDASGSCTATFRTKGNCALFEGIASATFTNARVGTTYSVIYNSSYGTGTVTVKGGKYIINGYNANGNFGFYLADGTNSFEDVTIDVTSTVAGSSCVSGPATLKNCNFTSDQCAVRLTLGSGTTIDGGTYNGDVAAVKNEQGTVTINSGTLTSAGNVLQTDGFYDSPNPYYAEICVNGGQFKGAIVKKADDEYNTISLKGGIYSADPSAYRASGYAVYPNSDESTKTEYPYMVSGPVGSGFGDIDKQDGTW